MKRIFQKLLLGVAVVMTSITAAHAQLPDGSIAPDFTVTAYQSWLSTAGLHNNGTYNLYEYLNQGKVVFMDVSATWCAPCWTYHVSGKLDALYADHGPTGQPGVSASTTNDVMVIWVEGDGTTSDATMTSSSNGNWITPNTTIGNIEFPMANPASTLATQINNGYNIGYFPTVYRICPNRTTKLISTSLTAASLYTQATQCPAAATQAFDPALLSYTGTTVTCGAVDMKVKIQNNGTNNMTTCTIQAKQGTTVINEVTWTGNLATYGVAEVNLGSYNITANTTLTFLITSAGDANTSNNTITKTISYSTLNGASTACAINITLDRYGSETSWTLKDLTTNTVISTSPTYANASANGAFPQAAVNVTLTNGHCYMFEILDAYGDGMCCSYGNGSYSVTSGGTAIFTGGTFTSSEVKAFTIGTVGINSNNLQQSILVYPNPAQDVLNVEYAGEASLSIYNALGQEVYSVSRASDYQNIDISFLPQGTYVLRAIRDNEVYTTSVYITR
jgi:hypothetical protein